MYTFHYVVTNQLVEEELAPCVLWPPFHWWKGYGYVQPLSSQPGNKTGFVIGRIRLQYFKANCLINTVNISPALWLPDYRLFNMLPPPSECMHFNDMKQAHVDREL